ncbi:MAG TPA: dihydrolipoyl dehydrogenase [Candidatus Binatia bacterium]|nr:dihydrolipoyl dehydrogenase [Candidatus Solibacter sp.]HUK52233.1 dihydrolipoyl dehydrogenase [Candidatus Binatia bacterium]
MAKYDLAIIGSGPGGYVAAIRAGQLGLKTVVVEKDAPLGGTCLLIGCIPTKVLLHHAELYDHMKRAGDFGFELKDLKVNWPAILARKDKIIFKHSKGIEFLFKKNKVERVQGFGRWAAPGSISVEKDGKTTEIQAANILLATGSDARSLPGIEIDGKVVLTNREILSLPEIPKSLVIVGSGAVGSEFASIYNSFGTQVTVLEMLPRIVPLEDEEVSAELAKALKKRGIRIETGAKVESLKKDAKCATVTYQDKDGKTQSAVAEKVLMAVGRRPVTEGLNLEKTRARMERGFLHAGPYQETDEPGLYAIGDIVAGMPQLAHAASMEGIVAVTHMAGKAAQPVNRARIPNCTYCEPQIGSVGLTERAAREGGHDVQVGKFPFAGNSKATILGAHEGFIKVVADAKYGEVLGVHIIGPLATEVIAEAVTALQLEATVDDMMAMIHAHPTVWEALGDGFNAVRGMSINA